MSKWISVKDRLPEENLMVIVDGGIAKHLDSGWYSLTGIDHPGRIIRWDVTHWQPIPKLTELTGEE